MSDLYRVVAKTTGSVQPGDTFWRYEVLYCGYDRDEARQAFHSSTPADYGGSYGNPARKTECEIIRDSESDEMDRDHRETLNL